MDERPDELVEFVLVLDPNGHSAECKPSKTPAQPAKMDDVLCLPALERLCEELQDAVAAEGFLRTYLQLLPARISELTRSTEMNDHARLLDRALSLRSASAIAGAAQLARSADRVVQIVDSGQIPSSEETEQIRLQAEQASRALEGYLTDRPFANS